MIQIGSPKHNLLEETKVVRPKGSYRSLFGEAGREALRGPSGRGK